MLWRCHEADPVLLTAGRSDCDDGKFNPYGRSRNKKWQLLGMNHRVGLHEAAFFVFYAATLLIAAPWAQSRVLIIAPILALLLIWVSAVDLWEKTIPDLASLMVATFGVLFKATTDTSDLWLWICTAAAIYAAFRIGSEIYWRHFGVEALGLGDVKLMTASALCVGPVAIWWVFFLACCGGIAATLLVRLRAPDSERSVPFGPFLAYALFLVFLLSRLE